ncbi:hypothetical protein [Burkholderia ubonensis]|uniref:hypothetical protein n=1 Tax=Burkholderia ubonensis TaxID=101571 RepID=UPI000AF24AE7|nr:hypothetical protein [Burkholderia ubonensis]
MNLSKSFKLLVTLGVFALAPEVVFSGTLTIYNDLDFVTYKSGRDIYGYYNAYEDQFSCSFMFFANSDVIRNRDYEGVTALKSKTFYISAYKRPGDGTFSYKNRDPDASIDGILYIGEGAVGLTTDSPQGGCLSVAGIFTAKPGTRGAEQFEPTTELEAIGIAVISHKTFFHKMPGLRKEAKYLVPGDWVAVLAKKGAYSYVRYVNPNMMIESADSRKVTTGWVRNLDLSDPFPSSLKKELQ